MKRFLSILILFLVCMMSMAEWSSHTYTNDGFSFKIDDSNGTAKLTGTTKGGDVSVPLYVYANSKQWTVRTIGSRTFNRSGITKLYVSSTIKTLEEEAFAGCVDLKTIQMNDAITSPNIVR